MPPQPDTWPTVLAGLTGPRLALYDELLRYGELSSVELASLPCLSEVLEPTLRWLEKRRMVRGSARAWRAVPIRDAQRLWEKHGLAGVAEATPEETAVGAARIQVPTEQPSPSRQPVHAHQARLFDEF